MAMDLSTGYSVPPLNRSRVDTLDLAKKPEWYHRRPPNCSADISASFRSRASSSYNPACPDAGPPVHCRDMDPSPEAYMNPPLFRNGVPHNLWHPGFYGPDPGCGPGPESSGGDESDSGSDVIVLVSSAKEPMLCGSFIQDGVRHIVEPLSPTASSMDGGTRCYHLPQALSSPSPDSSSSDESSDSSVDIPVHHARPVVLLSDLGTVYSNAAGPLVDISSDDSDVIEVSGGEEKKRSFNCQKRATERRSQESESKCEKVPARAVRRGRRLRKPAAENRDSEGCETRRNLRRQVRRDVAGIYNEIYDSDEMLAFVTRMTSSDESGPNESRRASSNSDDSDVNKPDERKPEPTSDTTSSKPVKKRKPVANANSESGPRQQKPRTSAEPSQTAGAAKAAKVRKVRRRRKRRSQAGPSSLFGPSEPEIKLKYASVRRKEKKSDSFCPFVHVERRACTVVNYQDEVAAVRTSAGPSAPVSSSLAGSLPVTSCFQLGRLGADVKCPLTLTCCLCGQTANVMGLGDLHGPYFPVRTLTQTDSSRPAPQDDGPLQEVKDESVNDCRDDDSVIEPSPRSDDGQLSKSWSRLEEGWIHEDCGIWSTGVFLVRGRLYGLQEAAQLAQQTLCSTCQRSGAIMGCFQKGCSRNYHYRCAIQSGCVLNDENFSMRCPEHKNKTITSGTRHKR